MQLDYFDLFQRPQAGPSGDPLRKVVDKMRAQTMNSLLLLVVLVGLLSPAMVAVVSAASANSTMASVVAQWSYKSEDIGGPKSFDGLYVDPEDGTVFLTYRTGIMRIPSNARNAGTPRSVTNYRVSSSKGIVFAPCSTSGISGWEYVNCGQYGGGSYLGLTDALYFNGYAFNGILNFVTPWTWKNRLFTFANPGGDTYMTSLYVFDKSSFSTPDATYNPIQTAMGTPSQVLFDEVTETAYVACYNTMASVASVWVIPMATYNNTSTWSMFNYRIGSAIFDMTWDAKPGAAPTTLAFVGTYNGFTGNTVWTQPLNGGTPTFGVSTGTECHGEGTTIAWDHTSDSRLYVGCSGFLDRGITQPALTYWSIDPHSNKVLLLGTEKMPQTDGSFTSWLFDVNDRALFIGAYGASSTIGKFTQLVQYDVHAVHPQRNGAVAVSNPLQTKAMAFAANLPRGSSMFWTVGTDVLANRPSIALWAALDL